MNFEVIKWLIHRTAFSLKGIRKDMLTISVQWEIGVSRKGAFLWFVQCFRNLLSFAIAWTDISAGTSVYLWCANKNSIFSNFLTLHMQYLISFYLKI